MEKYYAVDGQSLPDVCMNTYGSMDYFFKLLQDSGVDNPNSLAATGQVFLWDKSLVVNAQTNRITNLGNIKFSTAYNGQGSTYFVVVGGGNNNLPPNDNTNPQPPIIQQMYQKTDSANYTAATDNITVINFPTYVGYNILQIERNIQPLKSGEYTWTSSTGVLTFTGDKALMTGEELYILFTKMITV